MSNLLKTTTPAILEDAAKTTAIATATTAVPTATAPKAGTPIASTTVPTKLPTAKANGLGIAPKPAAMPSGLLNDSVADKVKELTSQDSPLMQQARTDGLKAANRRGLLNSSMAVGAAQDAQIRQALPIAAQDATQAFQKNMQTNDQAWRSGESALDREQQTKIVDKQITSTEGLAAQQRALEERMQATAISAQDRQQLRDIASREGMAAADRALQELMQGKQIASTEGLAQKQRELEEKMQGVAISAQDRQQLRDISSREGLAAAERALQQWTTNTNRQTQIDLDREQRATQQQMQDKEIGYQQGQRGLDRELQEKLASWNLKSADRNAAAQFLTNMESMYQDQFNSIMANTNLDAASRNAALASAKNLRDKQLSFVEQMYQVDLMWTDADFANAAAKASAAATAPKPIAGFNEAAYLAANPDVAAAIRSGAYANAQQHYEQRGRMEGRAASGNGLNADAYLAANPDVAAAVKAGTYGSAQEHFDRYGRAEGRATAVPKAFNADAYLRANPDVEAAVRSGQITAQQHYDQYGKKEGRSW